MENTNPQYPSTKKNWDVTEHEAGALGSKGSAPLEYTRDAREDGVKFGSFVNVDANGKAGKVLVGDSAVHGVALISNLADGYKEREYNQDDKVAIARRDYFIVAIDTANPPVVGGVVRISSEAGIEGFLTSNATGSKIAAEGISIEDVFDTVAEVYLEGKSAIALA